jgi:ATP-dependent Clp endopeptidase proteolytic subunit ClpP
MDKSRLKMARPLAQLRQGRKDWYRIENKAEENAAVIHLMDEIGYFGITAQDFVQELGRLDVARIDVRINSPGGEVWDGLAIYNSLREHPAEIATYVDGLAASAASIILQAGGRRVAAKASEVMIHEAWGLVVGPAADMRDVADRLDQASGMIAEIYADRSGGTVSDWRAAMAAESWYTGTEAKAAGLVDEVAGESTGSPDNSWDLSIFAHAGRGKAPAPVIPDTPDLSEFVFDAEAFAAAMREASNA